MSLSRLSRLPSEVLSSVLNNEAIPLERRLRLRLLSNRWADIIEDGLKKVTSLVIRDERARYFKLKPDDLVIQSTDLTDAFTRPLYRLFTSITHLAVLFGVPASMSKIPSLLAHLDSTNLSTVKLYCNGYYITKQIEPIASALTALSALTSLTLIRFHILPCLKPVVSRLEKFGCQHYSIDMASILSSSLSSRCTHLCLGSPTFQSFSSPFLVELSRSLTHLHVFICDNNIWQSISQLHGLSSLALQFFVTTDLDSSLFSHLAPFSRLTQVKLYSLSYRAPLALPSKKETPLPTIKFLTLEMNFGDSPVDYQAFFQAISAWLPNLVKLTIFTHQDTIAIIRASLGKLPFLVEAVDRNSVDNWYACHADCVHANW